MRAWATRGEYKTKALPALLHNRDLWAILVLLAITLVVFFPVVFLGKTFWGADVSHFFYPTRYALADAYRTHDLSPLFWSPYIFGGYPLFAEGQTGTLYPLNLLYALPVSSILALHTAEILLHYFLAAVLTYAYARVLQANRIGALISALCFASSGFMISHLAHVSLLNAAAWLPAVFLLVELMLTRKQWRFLILLGVILAVQVFAGHPQVMLTTVAALVPYLFFRLLFFHAAREDAPGQWPELLFQNERRLVRRAPLWASNLLRFALILALIGILFAGLAAAQLIPLGELLGRSIRNGGAIEYGWAASYSLPVQNLVTLPFPFYFQGPIDYRGEWLFAETSLYVGVIPLVLALIALRKPTGSAVLLAGLGLLALLLAMGPATPLFWLLHQLPIYSGLRAPARFIMIVDLSLATLAGLGFTSLASAKERRQRGWLKILAGLIFLATICFFAFQIQLSAGLADLFRQDPPVGPKSVLSASYHVFIPMLFNGEKGPTLADRIALVVKDHSALFSYLLLLVAVAILLLAYRNGLKRWLQLVGLFFVAADLFLFAQRVNGCFFLPVQYAVSEQTGQLGGFLEPGGYSYRAYNIATYPSNALLPRQISTLDGYSPLELQRYQEYESYLKSTEYDPAFLARANVRYIIDRKGKFDAIARRRGFPLIYKGYDVRVYENPTVLPRAYLAHEAALGKDDPLEWIRLHAAEPAQKVVLEEKLDSSLLQEATDTAVEVISYTATRVLIHTQSSGGGLLVLSDSYYPGWQAFVDGQPSRIYRANGMFRAVLLSPGEHTVEFVYRPTALRVGFAVSLASGIGTAGVLAGAWWATRQREQGRRGEKGGRDGFVNRDPRFKRARQPRSAHSTPTSRNTT